MTDAEGRLRVLTMNVLELRYADGPRRRAALRRTLLELSPDVMALQEVGRQEVTGLHEAGWHVAPHPHWSADGVGSGRVRQGDMAEEAGRRIDVIMVRCDRYGPTLHLADCRRILVTPTAGPQVSDHYGLVADLTLPDHLPGSWA
ncbi:endonuclease/exonuclease/phosphatase family protein [Streptomyces sp. NPDC051322]|uniref:endonuclease/exonuclease/phosphatase family protein n=1 Tax=Streptomyces sp. NPDC051322 TaxID=3154645 RepID=UPI0034506362